MRPQGARHYLANEASTPYRVSIHAPTGGATTIRQKNCSTGMSFNSRARRGRDPMWRCMASKASAFQFTRPQGARHIESSFRKIIKVSIHAPTRGATVINADLDQIQKFQFTRPQGARPIIETVTRMANSFNSRAHKGRDFARKTPSSRRSRFQFTRPQGARPAF